MSNEISKKQFERLIDLVGSLTLNLDKHLEEDHKEEVHDYNAEKKQLPTTRFYLKNLRMHLKLLRDDKIE